MMHMVLCLQDFDKGFLLCGPKYCQTDHWSGRLSNAQSSVASDALMTVCRHKMVATARIGTSAAMLVALVPCLFILAAANQVAPAPAPSASDPTKCVRSSVMLT